MKSLEEIVNERVKELKKEVKEIKEVIFEVNSLTMEMPFVAEPNKEIKTNLTEKLRVIYANASDMFEDINMMYRSFKDEQKDELVKYIKQLNVYLNALSVICFVTNTYLYSYLEKYETDDEIEAIYNYYMFINEMTKSFTLSKEKWVMNLGEEYYK